MTAVNMVSIMVMLLAVCSFSSAAFLERRDCAADNCLRAVRATRKGDIPLAQATADCMSYLIGAVEVVTSTTTPPAS
jgi:hypothetical protein